MAHVQARILRQMPTSRVNFMLATMNSSVNVPFLRSSLLLSTRSYHPSPLLLDNGSSHMLPNQPQQSKRKQTFFWRRRETKERRNRISSLALGPSAVAGEEARSQESYQEEQSQQQDNRDRGRPRDRILNKNQRRILLFSVVLLVPIIGRDVMEVVIPGLLGTIIFVGSKVKSGIKWMRQKVSS